MFSLPTSKKESKSKAGRGWFDLKTMAAIFGMTAQGFHKQLRPLIAPEDVTDAGKRGEVRIRARGAIDAHVQKAIEKAAAKPDPLLQGAASPQLEKYRAARASMAELELAEKRGELIRLSELQPAFREYGSALRRAGELLQREFGNRASEILNEVLAEAEAGVARSLEREPTR